MQITGLEPARISPLEPKSSVAASFTISAFHIYYNDSATFQFFQIVACTVAPQPLEVQLSAYQMECHIFQTS